jgi:hypothetical protein
LGDIGGGADDPGAGAQGVDCTADSTHGSVAYARRLTLAEYRNVIDDVLGVAPSERYPGSYGESQTGYSTEPGINAISEQGVEHILYAAEDVAAEIEVRIGDLLPCAGEGDEACAHSFLDGYGRRLFRRTLSSEERAELLTVYAAERADEATFAEAIAVMAAQMLQMPAFLYIVEAPAPAGEDRPLSNLEIATRLAIFLWGSAPDDALLDRAERGELADRQAVLAEAERMLDDPKSDRAIVRFFREWTTTPELTLASKDPTAFPELDETLVASINQSFDRFVVDLVQSGGTTSDLLESRRMPVDERLAEFFGVDAVSEWSDVELPADRYAGVMSHPALLAAHSGAVESSYVFRGKFLRTRLLCQELAAPPPDAMTVFGNLERPEDATAQEISAVVRSNGACGSCHNLLDPPGLAFEHFDALGAYRASYDSGKAIDTSGLLSGLDSEPLSFAGPAELMELMAERPEVRDCLTLQVFRFMASRPETKADACALGTMSSDFDAAGGELRELLLGATRSDAFLYRRGE